MDGVCSTACVPNSANGCGDGLVCQPATVTGCGVCEDERGVGAPCDSVDDCPSRICAEQSGEAFCTVECSDEAPCPAGFNCEAVSASVSVCAPASKGAGGGGEGRSSSACAVHGAVAPGSNRIPGWAALALVLAAVFRRRPRP